MTSALGVGILRDMNSEPTVLTLGNRRVQIVPTQAHIAATGYRFEAVGLLSTGQVAHGFTCKLFKTRKGAERAAKRWLDAG